MDILFLSHCLPNARMKGEKIRAFQEIVALSQGHRVHLACFARNGQELGLAGELNKYCDSVYAEVRPYANAMIAAGVRFCGGASLNMAFYASSTMRQYIDRLATEIKFSAAVAYTLPMSPYVPREIFKVLDMVDVDSEKWRQYARKRWPGLLYNLEAKRLRKCELHYGRQFDQTFFVSRQEAQVYQEISGGAAAECFENGVDFDYFDPSKELTHIDCPAKPFVTFVGTMNYFPNVDGAGWFAREMMPALRSREPELEFLIVGAEPNKQALQLGSCPGVRVVGPVRDVRPFIQQARAVVAPLRLARGMQNKVLEALALGRRVYATSEVCKTFGNDVPPGIVRCDSAPEFVAAIWAANDAPSPDFKIREQAQVRFNWETNLNVLTARIESQINGPYFPTNQPAPLLARLRRTSA
jgi:sugar transferase (PEP-CTERM/EpsH1 system associated)